LAVDRFGDVDLQACCPAIRVDRFPDELLAAAARLPACPWSYTGPLENHPALLTALAEARPLWGNLPRTVAATRDPWQWSRALARAGLPAAAVRSLNDPPSNGRWLLKPLASAGGLRITTWTGATGNGIDPAAYFLQERVAGKSCSAVFVAAGGQACLLGVTQQLIGCRWAGACGFWYAGSLGPLRLPDRHHRQFTAIGDCLARQFTLRGLFGVDAVVNRQGVWTVEINPRYTASVELLDRARAWPIMAWHAAACRDDILPPARRGGMRECWGKAVLFAHRRAEWTEQISRATLATVGSRDPRLVADVPSVGTVLEPGQPILCVFAKAPTPTAARRLLRQRAHAVRGALGT
jgi:predicted ATP-grasp superfamily ATP-dependent carboligase